MEKGEWRVSEYLGSLICLYFNLRRMLRLGEHPPISGIGDRVTDLFALYMVKDAYG